MDTFYDQLQKLVDETPAHDVLLIMGDVNAKVGSNNLGIYHIITDGKLVFRM